MFDCYIMWFTNGSFNIFKMILLQFVIEFYVLYVTALKVIISIIPKKKIIYFKCRSQIIFSIFFLRC